MSLRPECVLVFVFASAACCVSGQVSIQSLVKREIAVLADQPRVAAAQVTRLAAGSIMPGTFRLQARSGGAATDWQQVSWALPRGGLGIEAAVTAGVVALAAPGACSSRGTLALQLSASAPVTGVLGISIQSIASGGALGVGNFSVDVFDDGVVDLAGDPSGFAVVQTEMSVTLSAQDGVTIGLTHSGQVAASPASIPVGSYSTWVRVMFLPNAYQVVDVGPGCLFVDHIRRIDGSIALGTTFGSGQPTFSMLALGDRRQNVVLPFPPGCPMLLVPTWSELFFGAAGPMPIVLPPVPWTIGVVIHAQTAYMSQGGPAVHTSQLLEVR